MFHVDFTKHEPQLLCHESYDHLRNKILSELEPFKLNDHFILFSSGTTGGDLKGYAVSKKALFANAEAVNAHFQLTEKDIWGLSLPHYHIGGLSVLARAYLLKNKVIMSGKWNPETWIKSMNDVTITTIVPTQLYDLVKMKLRPWTDLRYLVVGGDYLSPTLKDEALKLGWPVIKTFGMSEVCSQLASAKSPDSNDLEILPIHKIKILDERLLVNSSALFTLEFTLGKTFNVTKVSELSDPEGFYITKDRAEVSGNILKPLGRIGDELKISGHLVDMSRLKDSLSELLFKNNHFNEMEFLVETDERKGKKLVLLTLHNVPQNHVQEISKVIFPVKIDEVRSVPTFERTDLGKLKRK